MRSRDVCVCVEFWHRADDDKDEDAVIPVRCGSTADQVSEDSIGVHEDCVELYEVRYAHGNEYRLTQDNGEDIGSTVMGPRRMNDDIYDEVSAVDSDRVVDFYG